MPIKILYIITQGGGGGAQKYTLALAKRFGGAIAAGNESGRVSLASGAASKLFTDAQRAGLATFELKHLKRGISLWRDILAVWEIRRLINSLHPDIVHLNSTKAGILGSFAAIGTKTKTVFTAHGFVFNEPFSLLRKWFYIALEKAASLFRDYIIAVSNSDMQSALDYNLINPNKIITIHNGLPEIDFLPKDEAKKILGLDANKIIIGNTSNFYRTKGLDILISAIAGISKPVAEQCQFVMIGDGPEIENLRSEIKNLQMENTVTLLGKKDNAATYLRAFDCFVLPSRKEGLPFALLEAMQAGLPIVAANVGGIPEGLGSAGILVEPQNPKALAKAIQLLLSDIPKQKELSQKALERAKLFTEEKMLSETQKIYKKLLE